MTKSSILILSAALGLVPAVALAQDAVFKQGNDVWYADSQRMLE